MQISSKIGSSLKPRLTLFLSLLTTISMAAQGGIEITSGVDRSAIKIGDLVTYTVELSHAPEIQVEMPELAENLGAFEIRDYQVHDPSEENGIVSQRVDYVISTFDVGEFVIPPLTFHYILPADSVKHELKTQKITIAVESLKPSEAGDIRDIKAPERLPDDYRRLIIWASLALAAVVLLAVSLYIWRRHRAGKGVLPQKVEPPRPAHELALEELDKLRESPLLAQGDIKEFHVRASEIIRRYVEGRYFIVALEMTSFELLQDLQQGEVESENTQIIQEFLEICDLVKFAKFLPTAAQSIELLGKAVEIVEKTKLIYDVPVEEQSDVAAPSNNRPADGENENPEHAAGVPEKVED